jgi:hypothetical protein
VSEGIFTLDSPVPSLTLRVTDKDLQPPLVRFRDEGELVLRVAWDHETVGSTPTIPTCARSTHRRDAGAT